MPDIQQVNNLLAQMCSSIQQQVGFASISGFKILQDVFSDISIENDEILLSDEIIEKITDTVDLPNSCESDKPIKSFSVTDFLYHIIFPLLIALLPIISDYYLAAQQKLDNQKEVISESLYREESLQLEKERLEIEQSIAEYLHQISEVLNISEDIPIPSDEIDSDLHKNQEDSESLLPVDSIEL